MQATDPPAMQAVRCKSSFCLWLIGVPPIPKCKYSQQQIYLPLAASAFCCYAKLLIQTVVQKRRSSL